MTIRYVGIFFLLFSFTVGAQDGGFSIGEKISIPPKLMYSEKGSAALGDKPVIKIKHALPTDDITVDEIFLGKFDRDTMLSNCSIIMSDYDISDSERYVRSGELIKMKCTTTCPPNTCDPETENCGPREGCTKTCVDDGDGKHLSFLLSRSLCKSLPRR